tara:strand:+ start:2076 stop:2381 length:306 start_codon:yes stop_codon:yes gene_type:complete
MILTGNMMLFFKRILKDFSKFKLRRLFKQDIIVKGKLPNNNKTNINKLTIARFNLVTSMVELSFRYNLNVKDLRLNLFKPKVLEIKNIQEKDKRGLTFGYS